MSDFNKDKALSHYHELNLAEDELALQDRLEEANSIHLRLLELEQEAMENGYMLTVLNTGMWHSPGKEMCEIREMTPKEQQTFLTEGCQAVYRALADEQSA